MKEKLKIPKKSFLISTRHLKELKHQASGIIYNTRILKIMKQSLHKRNYNEGKFKKTTKGISNNISTRYLKVVKHPLHKTNLNDENLKNRKENKYTRKHKL